MKSFLSAVAVTVLLAIAASLVLDRVQQPVDVAFATSGVRLGTVN